MEEGETKEKRKFIEGLRRYIDGYFVFRRVEIHRQHVSSAMWLTIRQGIIHIFTVAIFTLIMVDVSSQNYQIVAAFKNAFAAGE